MSLVTKLGLYEICVLSVLLYCSKLWTLFEADVDRLQAFHFARYTLNSLARLRNVRSVQRNVKDHTRLQDIEPMIQRRRLALFGHVARIQPWSQHTTPCGPP